MLEIYKSSILLSLTLFTLTAGAAPVGTRVEDSDRDQLVVLQSALEKTFKSKCQAISKDGNRFVLDTSSCIPGRVRDILGKRALIGGPNCYNFALYSIGILDSLRAVNSNEVDEQFFTPRSSTCSEMKTAPQPGQIVSLEEKRENASRKIHAYVHLTDKYALTKNGPDTDSFWQISTLDRINAAYPIPNSERLAISYKCTPQTIPQLPGSREIRDFSKLVTDAQIASKIPANLTRDMEANIANLDAILNAKNIKALDSGDPTKLYELVAQLYPVKVYYYGLQKVSQESADSFRPSAETFLKILSRVLDTSRKEYGLLDVTNADDQLEYEFCKNHQASICSLDSGGH
ncbi:MAG: hypothetical protein AB7K68_09400 [Bacteriovoracia bacterium]